MMDIQQLIRDKVSYNTANVFGVIAYTEENPYMVKVLRDKDYWRSLNARTRNWILYAARPSDLYSNFTDDYIIQKLGIKTRHELPTLIVFALGPDQTILQKEYSIKDSDEATTYNSLEETVRVISRAVAAISPDYISSTNVFREVNNALGSELAREHWKKSTQEMKELFKTLFNLTGLFI